MTQIMKKRLESIGGLFSAGHLRKRERDKMMGDRLELSCLKIMVTFNSKKLVPVPFPRILPLVE